MTLEREQSIVAQHAAAVVGDLNEFFPAGFDLNPDAGGTCIQGIFEQFLGYRSWSLDHFTGGNFVGNIFGKDVNFAHAKEFRVC